MKIKVIFLGVFFFINLTFSQVGLQWARHYNGTGNGDDAGVSIAADAAGNIYTACASHNPSLNKDIVIVKYSSSGQQMWTAQYNGPGNGDDIPSVIKVDENGFVYVTGYSPGSGTSMDCVTLKYNSSGVAQWIARYNNPGNTEDFAYNMAVENNGFVYVVGKSGLNFHDLLTIKYNSSGDTLWTRRVDYFAENREDFLTSVGVDFAGNIYVGGTADWGAYGDQAILIRYSPAGVRQWSREFGGVLENDYFHALAVDASGNIYITGLWNANPPAARFVTNKYNSVGTLQWSKLSPWSGNAYLISLDNSGNIIIAGHKGFQGYSQVDYGVIKYDPNGDTLWTRFYNGPSNSYDIPRGIAIDASDSIYITGESMGNGYDFATLKYSPQGNQQWIQRFNLSGSINDGGSGICLDNLGNVYVTGYSGSDMTTIRYSQYLPSVPILVSPANNATGLPVNLNLVWHKSTLAVNYRVQLATDSLFTNLVVNDSTLTDTIRAVTGLANNTNYWWRVNAKTAAGTSAYSTIWKFTTIVITGIQTSENEIPKEFKLYCNYPNPFNPATKIKFDIPKTSFTKLVIYDLTGKTVSILINETLKPGSYKINWDASNFSSGVYIYRLVTGNFTETGKMVLLK
jgi:uncharacterized delta-60 repeat protein